MKLKIHDYNLQQVWALLESGEPSVWLHGSGDIFRVYVHNPLIPDEQDHSKNHAENFNTGHEENGYRVKISKANMPKSVKEAEDLLMRAKAMEENEKDQKIKNPNSRVNAIRVPETDFRADVKEPAGDIDYSKFNKAGAEK